MNHEQDRRPLTLSPPHLWGRITTRPRSTRGRSSASVRCGASQQLAIAKICNEEGANSSAEIADHDLSRGSLTRILHEGGHEDRASRHPSQRFVLFQTMSLQERFVLIGFLSNLPSHLGPSPSIHSYGYGFSGDSPTCLARFSRNSDSFMQYAG